MSHGNDRYTKTIREKMSNIRKADPNRYWKGKKRPEITGENHYNWRGGITPINFQIRNSLEYKLWRQAVFERDKFSCVWCGVKTHKGLGHGITLHADHIKPFSLFPELRFAIDNGRTLCKECHSRTDTYMGRMRRFKTSRSMPVRVPQP